MDVGWDWGCSHNEGIALYPESSGPFTSLCFDDWRSGLFVSTGRFGGTHLRVIDWSGHPVGQDQVVDARIAGDIAALPDGSLVWAFAQATPDYTGPMSGSGPATNTLSIARLGE